MIYNTNLAPRTLLEFSFIDRASDVGCTNQTFPSVNYASFFDVARSHAAEIFQKCRLSGKL